MHAVSEPNWMLYASFVVSLLTLGALIWYACLTRGIERAANEQSEGLSKPILALYSGSWLSPEQNPPEVGIQEVFARAEPNKRGYYELANIGSGPAVDVECELATPDLAGGTAQRLWAAYLQANERLELPLSTRIVVASGPAGHSRHVVTSRYESVSGSKYESEFELEGDRVKKSKFRLLGRSRVKRS